MHDRRRHGPAADPQRRGRAPGRDARGRRVAAILSDVVLNGFGEGLVLALESHSTTLGIGHAAAPTRRRGRAKARGARRRAARVDRFGTRTACWATCRRAGGAEARPRDRLAAELTRAHARCGVVIGAARGRARPPRAGGAAARAGVALDNALLFGAERRLAMTLQRSLQPTALPSCRGSSSPRATCRAPADRTSAATSTWATSSTTAACCWSSATSWATARRPRPGWVSCGRSSPPTPTRRPPRSRARPRLHPRQALLDLPMATAMTGSTTRWSRLLTFALAGHLPPLVAPLPAPPASCAPLPGRRWGRPDDYERHVIEVPVGGDLVLYTDGLIEDRCARSTSGWSCCAGRSARSGCRPGRSATTCLSRWSARTAARTTSRCWS